MHHPHDRIDSTLPLDAGRRSARPGRRTFALVAALAASLAATDALAALSRWSASNNRIYVYGGGSMNLTDIRATTPGLPDSALQRVDAVNNVWLLTANIIVEEDTELLLTGDVKELRLQSNPSSAPDTEAFAFVNITAGNFDAGSATAGGGKIKVDGVKLTSWDTNAGGPDTNSADGRAYLRARSGLVNTVAAQSRMDILNSEVTYLGWPDSESYGLSWKVNGDLAVLDVFGDIKNSKLHHNYWGAYSFGLQGGQWLNNEVYSNEGYGLDAHDHSDDLVIDGNNVHDNGHIDLKGKHGIILSESCLNAQITNNTATGNAGNGIMLHNFSDNAIVEGNTASANGDAGIALFCSIGALVKGNTVADNAIYGIRLTVAANDNTVEGNQISGSGQYGIFMQPASDSKGVCGDLTPRNNTFIGNTVTGSGTTGLKITDATDNVFDGNSIAGGASIRNATQAAEQVVTFRNNTFGEGGVVRLDGDAAVGQLVRAEFSDTARVSLEVDTGSFARFTDDGGAIFDLVRDLFVQVTGSNSSIDLTSDNAGEAFVVDTRALFVTTDGTLVEAAPTVWETSGDRNKGWIARSASAGAVVQYQVGDLEAGVSYDVTRNGEEVGTFTADSAGLMAFSDTPGSTSTVTYAVARSAVQPQTGGGGGGGGSGGAGDPAWLLGLLVVVLRSALRRGAVLPALAGRR